LREASLEKEESMNKKSLTERSLVFLISVLALALAACGKSGPSTRVNFTMTDFAFTPNEFTVPAGAEITLHVSHNGTVEHNFIIMKHGMEAGEMFDETDQANVFWEVDLQPGDSRTVLFTAPEEPGTYQVICGMVGHLQSGMVGELVVTEKQ
jgi:uncharacterized cupredoxin-like copper-binding protein